MIRIFARFGIVVRVYDFRIRWRIDWSAIIVCYITQARRMSFSENGSHKEMASISYSTTVKEDGVSKPAQDAKTDKILICGLIVTIGLTWMMLLLPIIFYHLPDEVYARKVSSRAGVYIVFVNKPFFLFSTLL